MIVSSELLPGFESILDRDEKVLWTERPKFVPFLAAGFGVGLFIIGFTITWIFFFRNVKPENDSSNGWGLWFGLTIMLFFAWDFVKRILSFRNITYAYTNKRVMIRSGITGSNFKVIEFDKIIEVEVTTNFIERYYKLGTVKFFSGRTKTDDGNTTKVYDSWEAIADPHAVFKHVKEAMAAIKSKS